MIKTVVVAVDGSEFSAHALPVAEALAQEMDADLRVVGVAHSDAELVWVYDHVHGTANLLPAAEAPKVDVLVNPDPARVLLEIADDAGNVLCFASHDRMRVAAKLMHAVGSRVIECASHPFVVIGPRAVPTLQASDVVVALDGVHDPEPSLRAGVAWAQQVQGSVRVVTVYEPVLPDLRDSKHFSRDLGPPIDPDEYLETMRRRILGLGATSVTVAGIPDPVSVREGTRRSPCRGTGNVACDRRTAKAVALDAGRPARTPAGRADSHSRREGATMTATDVDTERGANTDAEPKPWPARVAQSFRDSAGQIVFGMEDGTVSIFGLVFGVAASAPDAHTVLLAGATGAVAAAVSMMAGTYLDVESENDRRQAAIAERQQDGREGSRRRDCGPRKRGSPARDSRLTRSIPSRPFSVGIPTPLRPSTARSSSASPRASHKLRSCRLRGCSSRISSRRSRQCVPFAFFTLATARVVSLVFTTVLLVVLGIGRARLGHKSVVATTLETIAIAAAAAGAGVLVGHLIS